MFRGNAATKLKEQRKLWLTDMEDNHHGRKDADFSC